MTETAWQAIDSAPKDGEPFLAWADGYSWPEVIKWQDYDDADRHETGEEGYFTYAEELLADVTDPIPEDELTHWMPLPPPPAS